MRTTRTLLETKVNNYNAISTIKVKLNDDVVGGINLYTEDNTHLATGKLSEIATVLDTLINIKSLENLQK